MTFADYFTHEITALQYAEFCLRLVVSCACGALIGWERSQRFKDAGVRTHIIVCCASALIMIVSKYAFFDLADPSLAAIAGIRGADPSRIAAQVVTGISFLCAGVIFKQGISVRGLTTAAGIWFTAGIGLTVGSGLYFMGIFATVLIMFLQFLMHHYKVGLDSFATNNIRLVVRDDTGFNKELTAQLKKWDAVISESKVTRNTDGSVVYELLVRRHEEITFDELDAFVDAHDVILQATNIPVR